MTSVKKLAIIGFGRVVELIHLPLLKHIPELEVCGVFDMTAQRLDVAARRGFSVFASMEQLLASQADAVLVATPPASHHSLARQALLGGKHVIIEKPVAVSGEEAEDLLQVARRTGKVVTVFHNRRFDPDYICLKQLIEDGVLGPLAFIERSYHQFGSGAAFGVKSFYPEWRNEAVYGGGVLMDWGVHLIDQLLALKLGGCLTVRSGMSRRQLGGDVEDEAYAAIELDNGIRMRMEINFGSHAAAPLWIAGGERAAVQIMPDNEAWIMERGKCIRQVTLDGASKLNSRNIYTSFVDCMARGGEPEVTLEQAVQTMKVLDAIRESARLKREVNYGDFVRSATG